MSENEKKKKMEHSDKKLNTFRKFWHIFLSYTGNSVTYWLNKRLLGKVEKRDKDLKQLKKVSNNKKNSQI